MIRKRPGLRRREFEPRFASLPRGRQRPANRILEPTEQVIASNPYSLAPAHAGNPLPGFGAMPTGIGLITLTGVCTRHRQPNRGDARP